MASHKTWSNKPKVHMSTSKSRLLSIAMEEEEDDDHFVIVNHVDMSLDKAKLIPATKSIIVNKFYQTEDEKKGLMNMRALTFLILWYIFSFCTLFLNKYILTTLGGDATLLGNTQMMMTATLGCLQMYLPLGFYTPVERVGKPPNFWRNMIIVGSTRFSTVVLGLVALKYVAVSFTETIKSSAPIFTVGISYLLLRERTGVFTMVSLIPVMAGLALCSAYELSFNIPGFLAALATNITECPAELQFFTSISSVVIQIPAGIFMIDFYRVKASTDMAMFTALILNGIFFHFQSMSTYVLMGFISPVTHSVANTVKRALLIWSSVIIFSNPVTFLSGMGTTIVIFGVLCYTKARQYDAIRVGLKQAPKFDMELNTSGRNSSLHDKSHISLSVRNSTAEMTENGSDSENT